MRKNREELSIIIVDDMKFSYEFLRRALNKEGYSDIRVAGSAADTLKQLAERPADVLLADWVMPEMDGLELTDRVRQLDEETNHYTCVIILTARDTVESVIEAFDRGVDDYLSKPPDRQELAARIHAAGRIAAMQNGLLDTIETLRHDAGKRSTIDALTGLGNRLDAERRFDELLKLVVTRGGAVCCGFLSVTRHAELIEEHGREVYEELLVGISRRLHRLVRPGDLIARVSDFEFVVGMHYLDSHQAKPKNYKRIMQGINLRPLKTTAGFITVNMAVAMCCNKDGQTLIPAEALMDCAAKKIPVSIKTGCTEVAV
jgi:diguanylate cyclase (GGDEF)-like protein